MKYFRLLVAGLLVFAITACSTAPKISQGSVVKVEYKGTLKDGTVFDSTEGKAPLTFLVGSGQVIPKFEEEITKAGEGGSRKFTISAKDAYGEPDPKKVVTVPRDGRFKEIELKEGSMIFANNKLPNGQVQQTPMKVVKLTDKDVTMDYNHPLAGKDLTFEVKVLEVQEPKTQTSNNKASKSSKTPDQAAQSMKETANQTAQSIKDEAKQTAKSMSDKLKQAKEQVKKDAKSIASSGN